MMETMTLIMVTFTAMTFVIAFITLVIRIIEILFNKKK